MDIYNMDETAKRRQKFYFHFRAMRANRVQIFLPQIKIRKPSAKQQSVSIIFFKSDHAEHLYLASPLNCECKYE